ncbi:hypothetical protein [Streptomyces sp. NPDC101455]|uniref:hypothetical protein n=1 Tax=Streptomyces sp. NPDC101455 TaxID=3366142 RepID=UPI0037FE2030
MTTIVWGRCRDGERWFWNAHIFGGDSEHGWAKDRNGAASRANAAAVKLAGGAYATMRVDDEAAEIKLTAVRAAKQAKAKAEDQQHTADGSNLWAVEAGYYDYGTRQWVHSRLVRLPIVKKTAKRIYFLRSSEPGEFEQGCVDRQAFESQGWVWSSRYSKIYGQPPQVPYDKPFIPPTYAPPSYRTAPVPSAAELKRLKQAMADAHPDRGGTDEAFIRARERYVNARDRAKTATR